MNYSKFVIAAFAIFFTVNNTSYAAALKEIDNPINDVKIYIYKKYIQKENSSATYTIRIQDKNVGDYINVINTNCSDFSSAIVTTTEYNSSFVPIYDNILSEDLDYKSIDKNSVLYNAATYACMSENTYTTTSKDIKTKTNINKTSGAKKSVFSYAKDGLKMVGNGIAAGGEALFWVLLSIF